MPVTYIPSTPNQTPDQIDARSLVQMGLAVHQQKLADEEMKKNDALGRLKMYSENPDLLSMVDPKSVEKDYNTAGIKLASPDQVKAMQQMIGGGGSVQAAPAQPPAAPVPPNQLEQLGATMQGNKAGAQSATPPSSNAANKAPGGGVTPGGIVTPGTGQLQELQKGAMDTFTAKVGALAPMYIGAAAQQQQKFMIAQEQQRIGQLVSRIQAGGDDAVSAYGELMAIKGDKVDPATATALLTSTTNDAQKKQAFDFFLHNESGAERSQRLTSTMTTLGSNKDFMGKLKDPTDLPRIAQSIVNGAGVPTDLMKRPFSLDEIADINKRQDELVKQGFDPVTAQRAAEAQAVGVPYTMSLPTAMHNATIPQQEAQAKLTTAAGAYMRGEGTLMEGKAALGRLQMDHDKITKSLDEQLKEKLENMLALEKGGVTIPQEMKDENLRKVAEQSGVSVQRVSHWYNWLYLGSQLEAQGGPASETALEGQAPNAPIAQPTPSPQRSHTKGVSREEAGRIRSMIGR